MPELIFEFGNRFFARFSKMRIASESRTFKEEGHLMRLWNQLLTILVVLLFVPTSTYAQAGAALTGLVSDTSGAVLPGTTVEARSPALIEQVRSAVTDET